MLIPTTAKFGAFAENPRLLFHYNLNQLSLYVGSRKLPHASYPKFAAPELLPFFWQSVKALGVTDSNCKVSDLTRDTFVNRFAVFFDLSRDNRPDANYINGPNDGSSMRLDGGFSANTTEDLTGISAIFFAIFQFQL